MPIYLRRRGLQLEREVVFPVALEGVSLGEFRADLVVAGKVIVELKACERIVAAHEAQLISYLKASDLNIGLLLNFGPKAELRRIIWTDDFRVLRDR
jgi:GxxExxY protein